MADSARKNLAPYSAGDQRSTVCDPSAYSSKEDNSKI